MSNFMKMKKYFILPVILFILVGCQKNNTNDSTSLPETITDIDGNAYNTVTIGTQVWMKENLKVTKFNDGSSIPLIILTDDWVHNATPAYCWYLNNPVDYKNNYGALYNWYAVGTGKLAPKGWHVPSKAEWTILSDFLGGDYFAGGRMKEVGTTHWNAPNMGADNISGFTALPAGGRLGDDNYPVFVENFYELGTHTGWWSIDTCRFVVNSQVFHSYIYSYYNTFCGSSVRCIKD